MTQTYRYHKFEILSGVYTMRLSADKYHRPDPYHTKVTYKFTAPDKSIVFAGDDFNVPLRQNPIDKDAAMSLLGFLTMQLGDTDKEYFDAYTDEQLAFTESDDCQDLSALYWDYRNEIDN